MANEKIFDLTELTSPASNDLAVAADVSGDGNATVKKLLLPKLREPLVAINNTTSYYVGEGILDTIPAPDMKIPLAPNTVYGISCALRVELATVGVYGIQFTAPESVTSLNLALQNATNSVVDHLTVKFYTPSAGVVTWLEFTGWFETGDDGGFLELKWSASGDSHLSRFMKGSWINVFS